MKAMCGGQLEGFCKGLGGVRPCPDHEREIMRGSREEISDYRRSGYSDEEARDNLEAER